MCTVVIGSDSGFATYMIFLIKYCLLLIIYTLHTRFRGVLQLFLKILLNDIYSYFSNHGFQLGIGFWRTDKHVFMDHNNSLAGTLHGCALTQSQLVPTLDLRIEMTGLIK
jgi:hypothetical protein